jgi:hypothetical protein
VHPCRLGLVVSRIELIGQLLVSQTLCQRAESSSGESLSINPVPRGAETIHYRGDGKAFFRVSWGTSTVELYKRSQARLSFLIPFWALSSGFLRVARHPGAKFSCVFARGNPPYGRQAFSQACDRERTAAAHGGAELASRLEK